MDGAGAAAAGAQPVAGPSRVQMPIPAGGLQAPAGGLQAPAGAHSARSSVGPDGQLANFFSVVAFAAEEGFGPENDDEEEVRQHRVLEWAQYQPADLEIPSFVDFNSTRPNTTRTTASASELRVDQQHLPPQTPKTTRMLRGKLAEMSASVAQAADTFDMLAKNFYGDGYDVDDYTKKQRAGPPPKPKPEPEPEESEEESVPSRATTESEEQSDDEDLDPEPGMPIRDRYCPIFPTLTESASPKAENIRVRKSSLVPGVVTEDNVVDEIAGYVEAVADLGFAHDQVALAKQRMMKGVRDAIASRPEHMDPMCAVFDHYERQFEAATLWKDLMQQWERRGYSGRVIVAIFAILDFIFMNAFSYTYNFIVSAILGIIERWYKNTRKVPPCYVVTEEDHTIVKINHCIDGSCMCGLFQVSIELYLYELIYIAAANFRMGAFLAYLYHCSHKLLREDPGAWGEQMVDASGAMTSRFSGAFTARGQAASTRGHQTARGAMTARTVQVLQEIKEKSLTPGAYVEQEIRFWHAVMLESKKMREAKASQQDYVTYADLNELYSCPTVAWGAGDVTTHAWTRLKAEALKYKKKIRLETGQHQYIALKTHGERSRDQWFIPGLWSILYNVFPCLQTGALTLTGHLIYTFHLDWWLLAVVHGACLALKFLGWLVFQPPLGNLKWTILRMDSKIRSLDGENLRRCFVRFCSWVIATATTVIMDQYLIFDRVKMSTLFQIGCAQSYSNAIDVLPNLCPDVLENQTVKELDAAFKARDTAQLDSAQYNAAVSDVLRLLNFVQPQLYCPINDPNCPVPGLFQICTVWKVNPNRRQLLNLYNELCVAVNGFNSEKVPLLASFLVFVWLPELIRFTVSSMAVYNFVINMGSWLYGAMESYSTLTSYTDARRYFVLAKQRFKDRLCPEYRWERNPDSGRKERVVMLDRDKEAYWRRSWDLFIDNLQQRMLITEKESAKLKPWRYKKGVGVDELPEEAPASPEAVRRMCSYLSGLRMDLPRVCPFERQKSMTLLVPAGEEFVMYQTKDLLQADSSGISCLEHIIHKRPIEWRAFLATTAETAITTEHKVILKQLAEILDSNLQGDLIVLWERVPQTIRENVRLWASLQYQPVARTVYGVMTCVEAFGIMCSAQHPTWDEADVDALVSQKLQIVLAYQNLQSAKEAHYKFEAAKQSGTLDDLDDHEIRRLEEMSQKYKDLCFMMSEFPSLRVVFIEKKGNTFFSVMIGHKSCLGDDGEPMAPKTPRAGAGKKRSLFAANRDEEDAFPDIVELGRLKLPGEVLLMYPKGENQNHALSFIMDQVIQTLDSNQDWYVEETFKIPAALQHFNDPRCRMVGFPEYVITETWNIVGVMSGLQERMFNTLTQRGYAFLDIRNHYGHPDFHDAYFVRQFGGLSCTHYVSEDIFQGYNVNLHGQRIVQVDFMEGGKARDCSMLATTKFQSKISQGAAQMGLSREYAYMLNSRNIGPIKRCLLYNTTIGPFLGSGIVVKLAVFVLSFCHFGMWLMREHVTEADVAVFLPFPWTWQLGWFLQMGLVELPPFFLEMVQQRGLLRGMWEAVASLLPLAFYSVFHHITKASGFLAGLKSNAAYIPSGRGFGLTHENLNTLLDAFWDSHFRYAFLLFGFTFISSINEQADAALRGGLLGAFFVFASCFIVVFLFNPGCFPFGGFSITNVRAMHRVDMMAFFRHKLVPPAFRFTRVYMGAHITAWSNFVFNLSRVLFVAFFYVDLSLRILVGAAAALTQRLLSEVFHLLLLYHPTGPGSTVYVVAEMGFPKMCERTGALMKDLAVIKDEMGKLTAYSTMDMRVDNIERKLTRVERVVAGLETLAKHPSIKSGSLAARSQSRGSAASAVNRSGAWERFKKEAREKKEAEEPEPAAASKKGIRFGERPSARSESTPALRAAEAAAAGPAEAKEPEEEARPEKGDFGAMLSNMRARRSKSGPLDKAAGLDKSPSSGDLLAGEALPESPRARARARWRRLGLAVFSHSHDAQLGIKRRKRASLADVARVAVMKKNFAKRSAGRSLASDSVKDTEAKARAKDAAKSMIRRQIRTQARQIRAGQSLNATATDAGDGATAAGGSARSFGVRSEGNLRRPLTAASRAAEALAAPEAATRPSSAGKEPSAVEGPAASRPSRSASFIGVLGGLFGGPRAPSEPPAEAPPASLPPRPPGVSFKRASFADAASGGEAAPAGGSSKSSPRDAPTLS